MIGMNSNGSYEEAPERILVQQRRKLRNMEIPMVKILLQHHTLEEATWETEEDMRQRYPKLFADRKLEEEMRVTLT